MTGAELVAKLLKGIGVERIYMYPGGTIVPTLIACIDAGIEFVCMKNEQGAGYAAIGAAKASGKVQAVMVTSGPGATNLVTPVADAYFDSVPIIALTGQVPVKNINWDHDVRQAGFQEVDSLSTYRKITKSAKQLRNHRYIGRGIARLFHEASTGRQGPVLLDLPMDMQKNEIECAVPDTGVFQAIDYGGELGEGDVEAIANMVAGAERPAILVGNGVHLAEMTDAVRRLAKKLDCPVVSSLPGVGVMDSSDPLYMGFIGHTGEYFANLTAYHCDVLLVLAARLDLRQLGSEVEAFLANKTVLRFDIDQSEIDHLAEPGIRGFRCDLAAVVPQLLEGVSEGKHPEWRAATETWREEVDSKQFYEEFPLSTWDVVKGADAVTKGKTVAVSAGVGIHQQLAARYFGFDARKRLWMSSCGHGAMGYDIPTVVGALIENPEYEFGIVFVGDGSFQMNCQELATIAELQLPVKIVVLDNHRLGLVSQFQLYHWPKDYSTGDKINPDFKKIGEAYGFDVYGVTDRSELDKVMEEAFSHKRPSLLHCAIDSREDVLPMLRPNQKMNEMFPYEGER